MKEVSECIVLPPDARSPRVVKQITGTKEKKKHKPITPEQFKAVINGGRGGDAPKLHNHGLWLDDDGIAHCSLCNATIELLKNLRRHTIESKKHKELYQKKMAGAVKLHQQSVKLVDKKAKGSELSDDLKDYRFKALISAAKHNVPTEAMKGLCQDFVDEYAGLTFGDGSDVVSLAAGPLLETLVLRIRQILSGEGCYDEFGVTFDGTPSFAEAEAIVFRVVTKDWEVVEILVRCGLYRKKLDKEELSSHIIDAITTRAALQLTNWMSTHQDRARVNKGALGEVKRKFPDATPAENYCTTHTVNNAGKKAMGDEGVATFAHLFRKSWQAVINTPGKARGRFAELFGKSPTTASGVRFFVRYEQVAELFEATPERIMEIVRWCIENKVSELSAKSMMLKFDPTTDACASLAMAMVEVAVVAEGVRPFAEACYTLEGDSCLILRAYSVFRRLEQFIGDGYSTPKLEEAVDRAIPLIIRVESSYTAKVAAANAAVESASGKVAEMVDELKRLNEMKKQVQGGTSSRGRVRQATERTRDNNQLDNVLEQIVEARLKEKSLMSNEKAAKDALAKVVKAYDDWKKQYPHRTKIELMDHGKNILKPVGQYYHDQFTSEDGDCYPMREMSEAAQMFNPIFLAKMSDADIVVTLHYLADKLTAFDYRHFDDKFIKKLKKEMPSVVEEAKGDHDLDRIPSSRQYQTRMQRRIKRKNLPADSNLDWKADAGEYAQRIWKWWKPRKDKYPCHGLAIRLIVLAQLSSCSVERVFSKLEKIREVCGDSLKGDMCEIRLLLQVNGDMDDMYNGLVLNRVDGE